MEEHNELKSNDKSRSIYQSWDVVGISCVCCVICASFYYCCIVLIFRIISKSQYITKLSYYIASIVTLLLLIVSRNMARNSIDILCRLGLNVYSYIHSISKKNVLHQYYVRGMILHTYTLTYTVLYIIYIPAFLLGRLEAAGLLHISEVLSLIIKSNEFMIVLLIATERITKTLKSEKEDAIRYLNIIQRWYLDLPQPKK